MIRSCTEADFESIFKIINDGAQAYKGIIPEDRWHDPYMTPEELRQEVDRFQLDEGNRDRILFYGYEEEAGLTAVMGIQDKGDVTLIRHAYVKTSRRNQGIGEKLLRFLESKTNKPILIGTWAAAVWAISFYEKNGYRLLEKEEKNRLLRTYWTIPERQIETSVVLANARWRGL